MSTLHCHNKKGPHRAQQRKTLKTTYKVRHTKLQGNITEHGQLKKTHEKKTQRN